MEPLEEVIGQDRAVEAVRFGIEIRRRGFNIFAFGPAGTGKSTTIQHFLHRQAQTRPAPDAWCYVANFDDRHHPKVLRLPPGRAVELRQDMERLIEELLVALPAAFDTDTYTTKHVRLAAEYDARSRAAFEALRTTAAGRGLTLVPGTDGLEIAPITDGQVMSPEAFRALPADQQAKLETVMAETEADLESAARANRGIEAEERQALSRLDQEVALAELQYRMDALRERYQEFAPVVAYLEAVQIDILDHLEVFSTQPEDDGGQGVPGQGQGPNGDDHQRPLPLSESGARIRRRTDRRLRRYAVNVLVDHGDSGDDGGGGAPVIAESHPTLGNLVGRIEHEQYMGALVTDFSLIRPGALHKANGGYLVLEAEELLKQPYSWDALKRALRNEVVRIESPGDEGNPTSTITLEPEPVPLDCKVILIGDPFLYFNLHENDPDFPELFKVAAEFGDSMRREVELDRLYARFIATVVNRENLIPFEADAVARVIEHSIRLSGDSCRLSTRFLDVTDLLREADYWAAKRNGANKSEIVTRADVRKALETRVRRLDLFRERLQEQYARAVVLLDTTGEQVGRLNGLTVVERGDFHFGLPVRISATVRLGSGEVLDIEREVDLGGPLHSKGVLILSGFIHGRFLPDEQLAMSASLTFEQSYGEVDGDSASSAELYALLSALSGLPIRQSLAVTGSVNQSGQVQAIGGVNEKVEGFFDICRQQGLTGEQGVLIPVANVQHLMLRDDVVDAVRDGQFSVYPIRHVDEGIELLTGHPAGERDADGQFPDGSVNRLVEDRLRVLAEKRKEAGVEDEREDGGDGGPEREHGHAGHGHGRDNEGSA